MSGVLSRFRFAASLIGSELAAAKKEGFQTPFSSWFAGPSRSYLRDGLVALRETLPGVLDECVVRRIRRARGAHARPRLEALESGRVERVGEALPAAASRATNMIGFATREATPVAPPPADPDVPQAPSHFTRDDFFSRGVF